MSMICELLGLSPAQIDALHAAPQLAGDLANVAHDEAYARERADFRSRMPPDKRAEFEVEDRASEEIPEVKEAKRRIAEAAARIERLRPIEELLDLGKS
jgi:hypothetical protein